MIIIHMKNVTSKIDGLNDYLRKHILTILSYVEQSFGTKPESKYLFNTSTCITYTGLVPYIIEALNQIEIGYTIDDQRVKPEASGNFKINDSYAPRDYQKNIIDNVSSREICQAATGAGKTYIMAEIIAKHNVKPVIVIAPKVSLAIQIKNEFEKFLNTSIGICGGGYHELNDITICTPQSVPDELLKSCKMIMWDEFHNAGSDVIFKTGTMSENAYYRYGVSATPWRDDGKDLLLEAITNIRKPQLSINASMLINKGKLVPCTIEFLTINTIFNWNGSYDNLYKEAIVNNKERNEMIVNKAIEMYNEGRTSLILIKNIEHGKTILEALQKQSIFINNKSMVQFLSGEDNGDEREKVINQVKSGEVKILIGSTIADEGLDLPILDSLILAGGGKSSCRAFQRIGRVLRLYLGKLNAKVFDFKDMTPTLFKHYQYRKALYQTESRWTIIDN